MRLAADVGGDPRAAAVVLLHGGGQTRQSWRNCFAALANAGYHVINLDLRGHGDSAWPEDGDYSIDALCGDLMAVLSTLPNPPALVGASLGGVIGLICAGGRAALAALAMVDVTPRLEMPGVGRIVAFMTAHANGFDSLQEAADAVAAYNPARRADGAESLRRNLRQGSDGRWHWHWDPRFVTRDYQAQVAALTTLMLDATPRVRVPTLLVRGANSDVVAQHGVEDFSRRLPQLETVEVAAASHMVAGDRNDAFNQAILDFLRRRVPPSEIS